MPSFTQLFTLATLAAMSSATAISPIIGRAAQQGQGCLDSKVTNEGSFDVGGKTVTITSFSCAPAAPAPARRGLIDEPPLCIILGTCKPTEPAPPKPTPSPPAPKNVCGVTCTGSCNNNAGELPPISDDCDTIKSSIQIFAEQTTTFVVDANSLKTLTFGTCSYFFRNNGTQQLEYCWSDLSVTASTAGSACFPPTQPLHSEGICTSGDSSWAVGAAHS